MLSRLGRWARPRLAVPVWSSGVGLARTLIALGTLGTLVTTDPRALMSPLADGVIPPVCGGPAQFGLWCVAPDLAVGRWLSVAVLVLAAGGWRPRWTAVPHWYVAWSVVVNVPLIDGGDQISAVLTLLLLPICLTDPRRWHWSSYDRPAPAAPGTGQVLARVSLLLIQIQMAGLYLQASVAKLGVREWADGTAMYYWSRHPTFGSPPWLRPAMDVLTSSPAGVAALTWGSMALEFALAVAILLGPGPRRALLCCGLVFHCFIALHMGLVSFYAAMAGGLLLALLPVGHHLRWPAAVVAALRRVTASPAGPAVVLYDGDCGFCARSIGFVRDRLRPEAAGEIDFAPWQSCDLPVYGLTPDRVRHAVHLLRPDGGVLSGAAVFAQLAGRCRSGWPVVGRVMAGPPGSWAAGAGYRLVATHRHRLPGGTAACAVSDS
ncbi:hypothetical protein Lfu02_64620 [Longispora fulva]|uniref:Antimicrobial peptide system SdpB family protein n=1 Tax=Longispora fulva TaxID=619741 RepID=A0A8J7GJK4_9ACTN|nr:sporulation-delaying protein SdpB family protein [Longispora fulva]MBG6137753.1 antimicrobial peptide system SdpB family protein [Longispora fulva]GIG62090.1 hypothetical protein Lfu02_64620 [Longispora fulva]